MPPRNRQKRAYQAASTAGGYKASLYDISGASDKMDFAKRQGAWEKEDVGRKISAISDTLELASTVAGGFEDTRVLEEEYIPELEKARFGKEYKGALSFEEFKTQQPGEFTKQFETHEIERNMWEKLFGKERMYQFGSGDDAHEFKRSKLMAYGKQAKGLADYKALGMEDHFGFGAGKKPTLLDEVGGVKTSKASETATEVVTDDPKKPVTELPGVKAQKTGQPVVISTGESYQSKDMPKEEKVAQNMEFFEAFPEMKNALFSEREAKWLEWKGGQTSKGDNDIDDIDWDMDDDEWFSEIESD